MFTGELICDGQESIEALEEKILRKIQGERIWRVSSGGIKEVDRNPFDNALTIKVQPTKEDEEWMNKMRDFCKKRKNNLLDAYIPEGMGWGGVGQALAQSCSSCTD